MGSTSLGGTVKSMQLKWIACLLLTTALPVYPQTTDNGAAPAKTVNKNSVVAADQIPHPVLWKQPTDIASLDLYEGPGGSKHEPKPPFTFVQEAKSGTNPKFDVTDGDGDKWRVKLGEEARPEVVASRLLWAMGYYATYDYLLPTAPIAGIKISRGADLVKDGTVLDARFARTPGGQKKIGIWQWKANPFYGKREFNGLRVMMAVLNNWDLKDVNNAVYSDRKTGEQLFLVSDVGATFGSNGMEFSKAKAKGNLDSFEDSKFITKQTRQTVSFGTPTAPKGVLLASFGGSVKSFAMRKNLEWIGHDIPVEDAAWLGGMLAQLSHKQLVDAFRAGNFPAETAEQFVTVIEARTKALTALQAKP
jgi:hypothetical protein